MTRPCVLLVDDEPRILDALRRLLRSARTACDVVTATSPLAALELLDADPFDVVLSDMRMPSMDGLAFLSEARRRQPGAARVLLTGAGNPKLAVRAASVAHRLLCKPTAPGVLSDTIGGLLASRAALGDAAVLAAIGALDALPCRPELAIELASLDPRDPIASQKLVRLVESEPAAVLRLLQVANTTFFRSGPPVTTLDDALAHIGKEAACALLAEMPVIDRRTIAARTFDADTFSSSALALARAWGGDPSDPRFAAGLLHDIGRLLLARTNPERYDAIVDGARARGITFEESEIALGGIGHARIASTLFALWGLPTPWVVDTVTLAAA